MPRHTKTDAALLARMAEVRTLFAAVGAELVGNKHGMWFRVPYNGVIGPIVALTSFNQVGVAWLEPLLRELVVRREQDGVAGWQSVATAPKDGRAILLLSIGFAEEGLGQQVVHPPKGHIGSWNPDGDAWVDQHGALGGDCYTLAVTGSWDSGMGWFQPNEVSHWMPLPLPPSQEVATPTERVTVLLPGQETA